MMAVCHTAVPEKVDDVIVYQASSPGLTSSFSIREMFCVACVEMLQANILLYGPCLEE